MNPRLMPLHPYPFEKLRALLASAGTPDGLAPSICRSANPARRAGRGAGHPGRHGGAVGLPVHQGRSGAAPGDLRAGAPLQHPAPDAETRVLPAGLARSAVRLHPDGDRSLGRRGGGLPQPVLPDLRRRDAAGRRHAHVNADAARNFGCDWNQVPEDIWRKTRLVFVCSPGNPAGNVMSLEEWKTLFQLSDRHGFVIASDECYSEIYLDEGNPPLGGLRPRAVWATTATWWRSPACPSAPTCPACARASWPGTRR